MENGIAESIKYIKNRKKKVATEKKIFTIKKKKKKKKKKRKQKKNKLDHHLSNLGRSYRIFLAQ